MKWRPRKWSLPNTERLVTALYAVAMVLVGLLLVWASMARSLWAGGMAGVALVLLVAAVLDREVRTRCCDCGRKLDAWERGE